MAAINQQFPIILCLFNKIETFFTFFLGTLNTHVKRHKSVYFEGAVCILILILQLFEELQILS